jgi:D-alanyl-lipoteichoic acid acyltransferase DltB (MBOAT superfamily)
MGARLWLVAASLFFYAYWNIYYLPLILISMAVNFTIGSTISSKETRLNKKALLILGITLNVVALGYFKYTDFLIENINNLFKTDIPLQHIVLPLAISFFTFQQIAYLVDCYKKLTKEYDFLSYALFVSFFPQLIAGPIVAHYEMMPQFMNKQNLAKNYKNIFLGIIIFIIGLTKKIIIADNFAKYATIGFDELPSLTFWGGWFSSLSYTVQIYFDFSGYCDMAIGAALMFNIKLPVNFNSPYKALSIKDFWNRWHITLSRFLRDYLYIPFGGNRKGEPRACLNVFLVFLIGGLWHGAAWTFVIWGALHGLASVIYRLWQKTHLRLNKFLAWFITFNFINIAWVFFRAVSFTDAKKVLSAMVNITSNHAEHFWHLKENLVGFHAHSTTFARLLVVVILCTILPNSIEIWRKLTTVTLSKKYAHVIGMGLAVISIALLTKIIIVPYTEFIYFNF